MKDISRATRRQDAPRRRDDGARRERLDYDADERSTLDRRGAAGARTTDAKRRAAGIRRRFVDADRARLRYDQRTEAAGVGHQNSQHGDEKRPTHSAMIYPAARLNAGRNARCAAERIGATSMDV